MKVHKLTKNEYTIWADIDGNNKKFLAEARALEQVNKIFFCMDPPIYV